MKTLVKFVALMLFTMTSVNCISADFNKSDSLIVNIKWLIGTWETRSPRGSIFETWVLRNSSELSGRSYAINGNDTITFESVRLSEKNGKIHYIPSVVDQNKGEAVIFESSFVSSSKFIVENPEHDFPQVISYTRTGQDELVAEISGTSGNGKVSYQTFSMKRTPDAISTNIEIVKNVFHSFNERNWGQMAGMYANPAEFKDPAFGIEAFAQSREEIVRKYQEMNKMSPDIHDEILAIYPSGKEHVIVEFMSSGTASDGSKWKLPLVTIFTIRNNLVVKDFTYYDK